MYESYHLGGPKIRVQSPHGDGLRRVQQIYPDAQFVEGSVGHYTYYRRLHERGQKIVAEAWQRRDMSGWWLRIAPGGEETTP